jgi:hypothetical protein
LSIRATALSRVEARRLTRAADLVRAAIACAAAVFLIAGDESAGLKALLVLPPAFAGRLVPVHPAFDLLFALALLAEVVATSLGAYDSIAWGDGLSHIVLPLLSGPILYAGIVRLRGGADAEGATHARSFFRSALVTAAAVLCLGLVWELVEWVVDAVFGTDFSQGTDDTLDDLRNDAFAAVGSGVLVAAWLRGQDRV